MKALGGSNPPSSATMDDRTIGGSIDTVIGRETLFWTCRRLLNAVRVFPRWFRKQLMFGSKTVVHFARFLFGEIGAIASAPAQSKWALMPFRPGHGSSLDLSPFQVRLKFGRTASALTAS